MSLLEKHLSQLCVDLEMQTPSFKDQKNGVDFSINPTLRISMKELDPGIALFAQIGACPTKKREEFFILLMKANFLGQGTKESVIGLDAEEKFLTLSLVLPYDLNYKAFKESIEDFANYIDYWKEALKRHQIEADEF